RSDRPEWCCGASGIKGDNFTRPAICRAGAGKIADGSRILFVIRAKHAFICAQSLVALGLPAQKITGTMPVLPCYQPNAVLFLFTFVAVDLRLALRLRFCNIRFWGWGG